jgi:hypothetical protein
MKTVFVQMFVGILFNVILMTFVLRLGRKHKLNFRYTVGWLVLGLTGASASLLLHLAEPVAIIMNLSPAAFLTFSAVALLISICVQLSISISGMQIQIRTLVEEVAFLKQEKHR